jgi:hypothetical protein
MKHALGKALLFAALTAVPTAAHAGWVSTWSNTAVKQNGERSSASDASLSISAGRARLDQDEVITLIDYYTGRYTLLNPTKHYFWTGTIDDYVREMSVARDTKMAEKYGDKKKVFEQQGKPREAKEYSAPVVDPSKLPPLSITKTGITAKVLGYDTEKYDIHANGELFQEIWVAPTLDLSSDLNFDAFLAVQRKMSAARKGKSADYYNALYLNEDYRKLLEKAFVLKAITHHIAGGYERTATSLQQADVPADQFAVPDQYRRVRLSDVLNPPQAVETPAPRKKQGS